MYDKVLSRIIETMLQNIILTYCYLPLRVYKGELFTPLHVYEGIFFRFNNIYSKIVGYLINLMYDKVLSRIIETMPQNIILTYCYLPLKGLQRRIVYTIACLRGDFFQV